MRKMALMASSLALMAISVWATEPWKNADYEKWSAKDVDKILNNSPWAKSILVPYYPYLNGDRRETDQHIQIGSGKDPSGVADTKIYQPDGTFTLRWNSALTLRRALYREAVLKGLGADYANQRFLINDEENIVLVLLPTGQTLLPPTEPPTLRRETYLELHPSGKRIPATIAEERTWVDARDNRGYVFCFPQRMADGTPTITKDVTEIEFFTQIGVRRFGAKFRAADMVGVEGVDYF
jgi:hypothetical protein